MEDDKAPEIVRQCPVTETSSGNKNLEVSNTEQRDNAVIDNPTISVLNKETLDNGSKYGTTTEVEYSDVGIKLEIGAKPSPATTEKKLEALSVRETWDILEEKPATGAKPSAATDELLVEQPERVSKPNPGTDTLTAKQEDNAVETSPIVEYLNTENSDKDAKPSTTIEVEQSDNGASLMTETSLAEQSKKRAKINKAAGVSHTDQTDTDLQACTGTLVPASNTKQQDDDAKSNSATVSSNEKQPHNEVNPCLATVEKLPDPGTVSSPGNDASNTEQNIEDKPCKPKRKKHSKNKVNPKTDECENVPSVQSTESIHERRKSSLEIDPTPSTHSDCLSAAGSQKSVTDKPNELKLKINRLKDKLEKFSIKCAEADSKKEGPEKDYNNLLKRDQQLRSNSEQTSQRDLCEKDEPIGSTSLDKESSSIVNSKAMSAGSTETFSRPKKPRKRGPRRKSHNKEFSEPFYAEESELILNAETFLLLDLLFMPTENREDFIVHLARKKQILVMDQDLLKINPKIVRFNEILPYRNLLNRYGKKLEDTSYGIKSIAGERQPRTFEDFVNNVVHQELSEEQQKEFTFPVTPKKQRSINYYRQKSFEDNVEAFAQKCVEANLGIIVEGKVRISAKNNEHAYIKSVDGERDAMFSSQLLRKCALHGDVVRAFIRSSTQPQQQQPCTSRNPDESPIAEDELAQSVKSSKAFVIKIVEELHNRKVVGNFLSYRKDCTYITFVPRDIKVPNIRIFDPDCLESLKTGGIENLKATLYLAEITNWQDEICIGKILQQIGKCGELEAENKAILLQNNLKFEPYASKFDEMYEGEFKIPDEEYRKREDIRSECVFTIDPLTARDLDDAVSCKQLHDGTFEIGVHISDVSYYLDEESELDQIVKTRTTSIYMVNEVFHMLPKPLCMRCSLLPAEDKLTFSVFWIISATAEILATRFARTVIRSCTQFAYQHAQSIIDNPDREFCEHDFPEIRNGYTPTDVVRCVKQLNTLATILRNKRYENGAIKIDRPKIYFDLDPNTGEPISFKTQQLFSANFLIEEFMLLANQSVANFIYKKFPTTSILRNHLPPIKNVIKKVKDQLQNIGMTLDISSSKTIYNSLQRLVGESANPETMSVCLSQLISKPMMRARYICSEGAEFADFWHFALSMPIYTHFTSPIRRYPDVLVHRVLGAALGYHGPSKRSPSELHTLADCCNDMKYNARLADEDSINLYFFYYIKSKKSITLRAAITEITQYSFEAVLIKTGHQILVNFKELKGVQVEVTKDNGICSATISFLSKVAIPIQLKMCDDVWLEVTAEKKRLKGQIVPRPHQSATTEATIETNVLTPKEIIEKSE